MKKTNPYKNLPDYCFWKRAVSSVHSHDLDPVIAAPWRITKQTQVVTAGSCFAQHIARHLQNAHLPYLITESIMSKEDALAYNYGTFSARYGNIYTARQLLQLMQRVYALFTPQETVWQTAQGEFIDPFRPQVQPFGFASEAEFYADRAQHFAAVRRAFEELDVFIFTLGLTEAWQCYADGAILPLAPSVVAGEFDAAKYGLHNFKVAEIVFDMVAFIDLLRAINPRAKIILTVSPVPLIATALKNTHVLTATTYAKSALRAACEEIIHERDAVIYFPSYEIITGNYNRGEYFAKDCRSVNEAGVNHVMRLFLKHFANTVLTPPAPLLVDNSDLTNEHLQAMTALVKVNCDEEVLDN